MSCYCMEQKFLGIYISYFCMGDCLLQSVYKIFVIGYV